MIQVSGTDLVYFFQLETKIHLVETYRVQHNIVELTPVIPLVEDRQVLDKVAHLAKCMGLSSLINNSPPQDLDILFSRVGDLSMGNLIGLPSKVVQIQALDSLRVLDKMHLQWVVFLRHQLVGEGVNNNNKALDNFQCKMEDFLVLQDLEDKQCLQAMETQCLLLQDNSVTRWGLLGEDLGHFQWDNQVECNQLLVPIHLW